MIYKSDGPTLNQGDKPMANINDRIYHYYELTDKEIVDLAFSQEFAMEYHCFLDVEHGIDWAHLKFGTVSHVELAREFFLDLGMQNIYPENWS